MGSAAKLVTPSACSTGRSPDEVDGLRSRHQVTSDELWIGDHGVSFIPDKQSPAAAAGPWFQFLCVGRSEHEQAIVERHYGVEIDRHVGHRIAVDVGIDFSS